jgi:hypothetical protein
MLILKILVAWPIVATITALFAGETFRRMSVDTAAQRLAVVVRPVRTGLTRRNHNATRGCR